MKDVLVSALSCGKNQTSQSRRIARRSWSRSLLIPKTECLGLASIIHLLRTVISMTVRCVLLLVTMHLPEMLNTVGCALLMS